MNDELIQQWRDCQSRVDALELEHASQMASYFRGVGALPDCRVYQTLRILRGDAAALLTLVIIDVDRRMVQAQTLLDGMPPSSFRVDGDRSSTDVGYLPLSEDPCESTSKPLGAPRQGLGVAFNFQLARRHVVNGCRLVDEQTARLARMPANSEQAASAQALLDAMRRVLEQFKADLNHLERPSL